MLKKKSNPKTTNLKSCFPIRCFLEFYVWKYTYKKKKKIYLWNINILPKSLKFQIITT